MRVRAEQISSDDGHDNKNGRAAINENETSRSVVTHRACITRVIV